MLSKKRYKTLTIGDRVVVSDPTSSWYRQIATVIDFGMSQSRPVLQFADGEIAMLSVSKLSLETMPDETITYSVGDWVQITYPKNGWYGQAGCVLQVSDATDIVEVWIGRTRVTFMKHEISPPIPYTVREKKTRLVHQ